MQAGAGHLCVYTTVHLQLGSGGVGFSQKLSCLRRHRTQGLHLHMCTRRASKYAQTTRTTDAGSVGAAI